MRTGIAKGHSHTLAEVVAALAGKAATDHTHPEFDAILARLDALEAVEPPPPPDPTPVTDLVAAIAAAGNGSVIDCDWATFDAPPGGIVVDRPVTIRNAVIRSTTTTGNATTGTVRVTADGAALENVDVNGGFCGIVVQAAGVDLDLCTVYGTVYAGIIGLSASDLSLYNCDVNGVRPIDGTNGWNAYGITLTNLSGQAPSRRCSVTFSTIRNVPTWHGLDTHGGEDITFSDNNVIGCRRAIFLTNAPQRVMVARNRLICPTAAEQSQTPPGGAPATYLTDVRGISTVGGNGSIIDNTGENWPATRWWNPIQPGNYVLTGNIPSIP